MLSGLAGHAYNHSNEGSIDPLGGTLLRVAVYDLALSADAIGANFTAFVPEIRLSPLASRLSPLASRLSPLASRLSPLASRFYSITMLLRSSFCTGYSISNSRSVSTIVFVIAKLRYHF